MEIQKDELTGDIALVVTDWCDEEEIEEIQLLWESQIQELRNTLGVQFPVTDKYPRQWLNIRDSGVQWRAMACNGVRQGHDCLTVADIYP